jgi:hypothetical protein
VPNNYTSFLNIMLLQRFTLPNNGGWLDSINVYIDNVAPSGAVMFRVFPAMLLDIGSGYYYFPQFGGPAIDSQLMDKANLKMAAFNSIRMKGVMVPKEFFVSIEFTFQGGTNNTVSTLGDSHELQRRSAQDCRVIMINQVSDQIQGMVLDSSFVDQTQKPIYTYLYMTAYADTATYSPNTKIVTTPITTAYSNVEYVYPMHAVGIPRPAYRLITGPSPMTVEWYTGEVKWTPSDADAGPHTITVEAFNANNSEQQTYTLTVTTAAAPKITSTAKKTAIVGEPYLYQVTATGGPTPTFSLQTAVAGMTIDNISGLITFVPQATQVGSHIVGITARNAVGNDVQSFTLRVDATASAPRITSSPVITATVGSLYNYQVQSTGNPQPTYRLTKYPPGMSVGQASGLIEWTPSATGSYEVTVLAENRAGADSSTYSIAVGSGASMPQWASTPKPIAIAGVLYTDTLVAIGQPSPHYFLLSGPGGMTVDSLTGKVMWTPSRADHGPNAVQVRASNSAGSATLPYSIMVRMSPRITSTQVFTAQTGKPYSYQVTAEAEPAATFLLSRYPVGMSIDNLSGLISWTPAQSQVGQHIVTVEATNPVGTDQQTWTIDVTLVGIDDVARAAGFALAQNHPNPVTGATTIAWSQTAAAHVRVAVADMLGRTLAVLADGFESAGTHERQWTAAADGRQLPAGQYVVTLQAGSSVSSRMLTVLR